MPPRCGAPKRPGGHHSPRACARRSSASSRWKTHKMLSFKYAAYKVRWQAPDLLVIERSKRAVIGVTDHWSQWQKATVQTDFAPGTQLHDYSGANQNDVTVGGNGAFDVWVPLCNGSAK